MKKFKRILLLVATIAAGIIYFAEELGSVLDQIEKEKKEAEKTVSKWHDQVEESAQKAIEQGKEIVQKQEIGKKLSGRKGKSTVASLEIPVM